MTYEQKIAAVWEAYKAVEAQGNSVARKIAYAKYVNACYEIKKEYF